MPGEVVRRRFADATNARADAASGSGDFFVAGPGAALFEIDEAGMREDRVRVGVDEAGEDDFVGAVEFLQRRCGTQVSARKKGANPPCGTPRVTSSVVPMAEIFPFSIRTAPSRMMPRSRIEAPRRGAWPRSVRSCEAWVRRMADMAKYHDAMRGRWKSLRPKPVFRLGREADHRPPRRVRDDKNKELAGHD